MPAKYRKYLPVVALTLIGMLLGYFFQPTPQPDAYGAITGGLIGLLLGFHMARGRVRWVSLILLAMIGIFSYLMAEEQGLLIALVVAVFTLALSVTPLRELYGGNPWEALSSHLKLIIGLTRGIQIIDEGKTITPAGGPDNLLGPRFITVRPGNAVLMEKGIGQRRVMGPARFVSEPFEYVKRIFDLRPQQKTFTFRDVFTSDWKATTIALSVAYNINTCDQAREGTAPLTDEEIAALESVAAGVSDWQNAIADSLEGAVRQAIGSTTLDRLLTRANYANLEKEIQSLTNRRIDAWGLQLCRVIVKSIQPLPEFTAAQNMVQAEIARAQAWRDALKLFADGYQTARKLGMDERDIHREVLRRTIEQMAKDPATKFLMTSEFQEVLRNLPAVSDQSKPS